ncbi:MAG: YeeE/YedE family protein [Pseudomonadota bacterium]
MSQMQRPVLIVALAGLTAVAIAGFGARGGLSGQGVQYFIGALIGGLAGFGLYHAAFGFTAAWRRVSRERRGAGLRAQVGLLAMTCAVTYLLIGFEDLTGWNMHPVVLPMGLSTALGALIFGIGMQLGGGCASGTLFTLGGGSTRMIVVLAFFIAGSVWATAHLPAFWQKLPEMTGIPNMPGISLIGLFGPLGAILALMAFCATIWWLSRTIELRTHGALEAPRSTGSLLSGPWSLWAGAAVLAVVGILCFLVFARPWGITAGFALWGAQILDAVGVDIRSWDYWAVSWRTAQIEDGPFANRTSLMNFGIVFGAMAAAALAGQYSPVWRLSLRDLLTAAIGGFLMGYGARLSYGCNFGAYLGGIASGSLHGWWWLIWGFAGSLLGTRLRGVLAMDPPISPRGAPA